MTITDKQLNEWYYTTHHNTFATRRAAHDVMLVLIAEVQELRVQRGQAEDRINAQRRLLRDAFRLLQELGSAGVQDRARCNATLTENKRLREALEKITPSARFLNNTPRDAPEKDGT